MRHYCDFRLGLAGNLECAERLRRHHSWSPQTDKYCETGFLGASLRDHGPMQHGRRISREWSFCARYKDSKTGPSLEAGARRLGKNRASSLASLVCVPKSATNREFQRWCHKRNEPLEAHMPTKQQSAKRRRAGISKPVVKRERGVREDRQRADEPYGKEKSQQQCSAATHQTWHKVASKTFRVVSGRCHRQC